MATELQFLNLFITLGFGLWISYQQHRQKAALDRSNHVHKVQFEKEFEICVELCEKMVPFRRLAIAYSHSSKIKKTWITGSSAGSKKKVPTDEEFAELYGEFTAFLDINKAFVCDSVHKAATEFVNAIEIDWFSMPVVSGEESQQWLANMKLIEQKSGGVQAAIKKRFDEVKVAN